MKSKFLFCGIITLMIVSIILISGCTKKTEITEVKPELSTQQILEARQNYQVKVNDWVSTGWENHYNPNVDKNTNSFWTKLDLTIQNNNKNVVLDFLTVRVNIKHEPGSDGKDLSWGRLPLDVSNIKPGESKSMIVYYPGDLSAVTVIQKVYTTIESDITEDIYEFFKEVK